MTTGIAPMLAIAMLGSSDPSAAVCSTGAAAVAELQAVHEAARRAHLAGDAAMMDAGTADRVVMVSNGDINATNREKVVDFFKGYFARVKYLEWSDDAPPVIAVSPDGRMGWMAVKVRARYLDRSKPEAGEKTFKSSWIATYQRVGCDWKMTGNASAVVSD